MRAKQDAEPQFKKRVEEVEPVFSQPSIGPLFRNTCASDFFPLYATVLDVNLYNYVLFATLSYAGPSHAELSAAFVTCDQSHFFPLARHHQPLIERRDHQIAPNGHESDPVQRGAHGNPPPQHVRRPRRVPLSWLNLETAVGRKKDV